MPTLVNVKCAQCEEYFEKGLREYNISQKRGDKNHFCSPKCLSKSKTKRVNVVCKECSKEFEKDLHQAKRSKNHFCCRSCHVSYQNKNKKYGTRRSKLEIWLESQLSERYPNIEFHFNRKDTIQSELDIYIPSLSLAFELNGIFHYEPIYGTEKLASIQNNDEYKFQACLENNIELCILDVSGMKYFKESRGKKFLDIICSIINSKVSSS